MKNTFDKTMENPVFKNFIETYSHSANYFIATQDNLSKSDRLNSLQLAMAYAFEEGFNHSIDINAHVEKLQIRIHQLREAFQNIQTNDRSYCDAITKQALHNDDELSLK